MPAMIVVLMGTVLVNTFLLMHSNENLGGDRHGGSIAMAMRIGVTSLLVLTVSTLLSALLQRASPSLTGDVRVLLDAICTVAIATVLHALAHNRLHKLNRAFASSPLLIVGNALALTTVILALREHRISVLFMDALLTGIAFALLLILFVGLAARITEREVPTPFRLAPITLITAGFCALGLMGFTGIWRN
jgi:electron transport complex protein RnfA